MRILFKTADRSNLVTLNIFHHLEQRVFKIADCSKEGDSENFDWVVYIPWCARAEIPPPQIPKDRGYKTCAIISDLHLHRRFKRTPHKLIKYLNENFDLVLSMYGEMATEPKLYQKNIKVPYVFFPPWVETDFYYPSEKPSLYDVVLLGHFDSQRIYPFRYRVAKDLRRIANRNGWTFLLKPSPIGRSATRKIDILYGRGEIVGERYVETLGRSKVMIAGSSVYKYPLLRYFEGMACKTCVVGDRVPMLDECDIFNLTHYWGVKRSNWVSIIKAILEDDTLREYIIENAYRTILEKHTAEVRAKEMIAHLETYS